MKRNTLFTVLAVVLMSWLFCGTLAAEDVEFLYTGDNGPYFWEEIGAELDPNWDACKGDGGRQSPIDINNVVKDCSLEPLVLDLKETPIHLINNGHSIEQEYKEDENEEPSTLTFEGDVYELLQFHFHTFSEHTVGGQHGAMELHAVFQNINPEQGSKKYAVIGVIYSIGKKRNNFLKKLIEYGLPKYNGDETINDEHINLAKGLTDTSSYYTYLGSLTTPPCSETVTWIVLKQFAKMSEKQFQKFRKILGNNFRPLQKRNKRNIRATAECCKGQDHRGRDHRQCFEQR